MKISTTMCTCSYRKFKLHRHWGLGWGEFNQQTFSTIFNSYIAKKSGDRVSLPFPLLPPPPALPPPPLTLFRGL